MKKLIIALVLISVQTLFAQKPVSVQMTESFMKWNPNSIRVAPDKPVRWDYEQGLMLKAVEKVWFRTGDPKYFDYIQKDIDLYVKEDGSISTYKYDDFNIDNIPTGRALLLLYQQQLKGKEKYRKAADLLWKQLENQPKTKEGGYWHKKRYPNQMWLDGLFMGEPFAAEYSLLFNHPQHFDDIFKQFELIEKYAVDKKTGLIFHAYDESREQQWANKETGLSPHIWGRAVGWYAMALVDVLDYFPKNHHGHAKLVGYLARLAPAIAASQDAKSGVWYQILDLPKREGNYLEASVSSMFVYTLAKASRLGYIPKKYADVAKKGYDGILREFVEKESDGTLSLNKTVSVGGLGGSPYRDGSFEYYMSEPLRKNDLKGVGPFIFASIEMEIAEEAREVKPKKVALDYHFNREFRKDHLGNREQFHYTLDDKLHSGFWIWGNIFKEYGADIQPLKEGPTAKNLKKFDAYIIVDPDTPKETEKPNYIEKKDIKAIRDWVKKGGTLVLLANDTTNCEVIKTNELIKEFGIEFTMKNINFVPGGKDYNLANVLIEPGNEIFKNSKKLYIKELVTLDVKAPARALVKKGEDIVMAVSDFGKGRVFVLGDPWLYNEYVDGRIIGMEFDNFQAAKDLAKWMLK
jgi:unsaturated rhamnogalacturonyl hydrolase